MIEQNKFGLTQSYLLKDMNFLIFRDFSRIFLVFYKFIDGYYVAYKPITLLCILFMFIEMIFIYCHSCVMFVMKSMSMCND